MKLVSLVSPPNSYSLKVSSRNTMSLRSASHTEILTDAERECRTTMITTFIKYYEKIGCCGKKPNWRAELQQKSLEELRKLFKKLFHRECC